MAILLLKLALFLLYFATPVPSSSLVTSRVSELAFDLKPFHIDLSGHFKRLKALVSNSELPEKREFPGAGPTFGIDLHVLKGLQKEWVDEYDWNLEQSNLNKYVPYSKNCTLGSCHEISTNARICNQV